MPFHGVAVFVLSFGASVFGAQLEGVPNSFPDTTAIQMPEKLNTSLPETPALQAKSQNAIYVHPLIIAFTSQFSDLALAVPLTYEREFGEHFSLVARPTLYVGSFRTDSSSPLLHLEGFEGTIGIRNYINGRQSTGVFQGFDIGWTSVQTSRSVAFLGQNEAVATRSTFEIFMTLGYRAKWSWFTLFTDVGAGESYSTASGNLSTLNHLILKSRSRGLFPVLEANIGLGYPF